ncbi:MAG: 3-dehydroquinate synthase [Lachnospiraceae bacterium]
MSRRLTVTDGVKPIYDIVIEHSFERLLEELTAFSIEKKRICIVSDSVVASYYLEPLMEILKGNCRKATSFIFSAGEINKTLDTVRQLYTHLIEEEFDRNDMLFALGGGVVGDLTGYAAATYLRGIDFVQIPTTLLAQVDSSVGGKTGVDFDCYKNMVGAFHMPRLVYMNVSCLDTLPERIYLEGMGEVVKHGLIKDQNFYYYLDKHSDAILQRDKSVLEYILYVNCSIKREVVENDMKESGERALLNFGHTLGHAIEKLAGFQMYHGECVAVGAVAACYLSMKKGFLTETELNHICRMFQKNGLPTCVENMNVDEVIAATKHDKKMDAGVIKFILLKSIGKAYICREVNEQDMREALAYIGIKK